MQLEYFIATCNVLCSAEASILHVAWTVVPPGDVYILEEVHDTLKELGLIVVVLYLSWYTLVCWGRSAFFKPRYYIHNVSSRLRYNKWSRRCASCSQLISTSTRQWTWCFMQHPYLYEVFCKVYRKRFCTLSLRCGWLCFCYRCQPVNYATHEPQWVQSQQNFERTAHLNTWSREFFQTAERHLLPVFISFSHSFFLGHTCFKKKLVVRIAVLRRS